MKIFSVVYRLLLCGLGCWLLACSSKSSESTDTIRIALIPKTSNNLVFAIGNDGAQFAAREIDEESGPKVDVEYMATPTLDPDGQQALIRKAIKAKKDALIVSCTDETISEAIDEAVEAGIPVITYDSDCPDSDRLGFYSMVSEDTGSKGADLLVQAMGSGKKQIAILNGREGADNLERREESFKSRLAEKYPDVTIVTTVHCDETAEGCADAIENELIAMHPDLDGLLVVGLWGLLEACTCSDSGKTCVCDDTQMSEWKAAAREGLKTVAYDTLPFELELMKQGYLSALLGQKYFGWGYDSVAIMYDHLTSGKKVDPFIDSGFDIVCPNNVDVMTTKWDAADFTEVLEPECEL